MLVFPKKTLIYCIIRISLLVHKILLEKVDTQIFYYSKIINTNVLD